MDGVACRSSDLDRREKDPLWTKDYFVGVYRSLTCWKRDGKDHTDLNQLHEEKVQCAPSWRGKAGWRRDCVWLQEIEPDNGYQDTGTEVGSDKCVGQLQLIISVLDHARLVQNRERPWVYTRVFLEVLRWVNKGATDKMHRMLEVEKQPVHTAKNPRLLGARCF